MESNEALSVADRAAAAPFIDYPVIPAWYPPLFGAWLAAMAWGATTILRGHPLLGLFVTLVGCAGISVFLGWYRSRWGNWPDIHRAPSEIRTAYRCFYLGMLLVVVVAVVSCWVQGALVGAVATFLLGTGLAWWYERRVYPAACSRVRARLA